MSMLYIHKKNKKIYRIEARDVTIKVADCWLPNFVLYYQEGHPETKYVREYNDFLNAFEPI